MSSHDPVAGQGGAAAAGQGTGAAAELAADSRRVLDLADRIVRGGALESLPDEAVQKLLLAAVRLFAAKRDQGTKLAAFPGPESVTATDVAVTCVAMTEVVNLELFELALWAGWSNI
jgi:hypothetical protein